MLVRSAAKLTAPSPETDFLDTDIIEFAFCDMAYGTKVYLSKRSLAHSSHGFAPTPVNSCQHVLMQAFQGTSRQNRPSTDSFVYM